jgi:cytochrome c553
MIRRVTRLAGRTLVLLATGVLASRTLKSPDHPAAPEQREQPRSPLIQLMLTWGFRAAVLGLVAAAVGMLVVISGIVPIKASSGHWTITQAFLQFAKRRSVATHTLTIKVPPLDEHRLIVTGATHYDFGCRPCHGSPALTQPTIAAKMLPRPPDLRESIARYDPAEMFYIVKHGIKLTGMPAWPAQERDDEVWAMVAFLRRLPALSSQGYQELAGTLKPVASAEPLEDLVVDARPPSAVTESCGRCHGVDGLGRGHGAFPRLAGQRAEYLLASLDAYANGTRLSGIMEPVAAALDRGARQQIAQYYATRPAGTPAAAAPDVSRGRTIATDGIPDRLVPACSECHGPASAPRNPHYPLLAGQYQEYLVQQLSLFKAGRRGGTAYRHIMHRVAGQLTDEQIRAAAAYYASLTPRQE